MTEKSETPASNEPASDLRGTLVKRLAVAGALVAILLGVLAFFDYLASTPEEPEPQVFTQPVPVAPKKEVSQPVKAAENLPEPPSQSAQETVTEAPAPPKVDVKPSAVPEAKPEAPTEKRPLVATPVPSEKPLAVPPTAVQAPARPPRTMPEGTAAPSVVTEEPSLAVLKPSPRLPETRPVPTVVSPSASRLFAGFLLQAGVFSSAQRAEELHARLTLSGVPSTLEARVQVGPFRTRKEAEAAQAKLRELGIEAILVPPKGGKS